MLRPFLYTANGTHSYKHFFKSAISGQKLHRVHLISIVAAHDEDFVLVLHFQSYMLEPL